MPLLPGETRESDQYVSGLSFLGFDRARENLRRWADSSQARIEEQYSALRQRYEEAQGTGRVLDVQPSLLMAGHMVPAPINWDDENILRSGLSTVLTVGNTLRHSGDPFNAAPVTMLLIGANAFVFLQRMRVRQWCLSPYRILQHTEWYRLITTSFLHPNLPVFLHNMGSLLRSGLILERGRGWRFLAQVVGLAIASNATICASAVAKSLFADGDERVPYFLPAIGFAGTCAALQVVATHRPESREDVPEAIQLSGKYRAFSCWLQLALLPMMVPSAGSREYLDARLCGIVTGLLFVWGPRISAGQVQWFRIQDDGRGRGGGYTLAGGARFVGGGGRLGSASEEGWEVGGVLLHPLLAHLAIASVVFVALWRQE